MNGVHDMGGMQCFGPVRTEKDEPVFHEEWEGRLMAIRRALAATGKLPPILRPAIESIPAADYLSMSYYERWYAAVVELLAAGGVVTLKELADGTAQGAASSGAALNASEAAALPFRVPQVMLKTAAPPRYSAGQRIRTRNINPSGHTRLPRYARGRTGFIECDRGVQAFPDTEVYGLGENPQHVYCVRFTAQELWGEQAAPRDSVYMDLWEDYLEPA
jgi:nitrile hydratase